MLYKAVLAVFLVLGAALDARADLAPATNSSTPAMVELAPYAVADSGPHHQVWQRVLAQTNLAGRVTYRTNSYTQLATGLNHRVGNHWVPASEEVEITADGAEGTNCQHQVHFPASFLDSINLRTPEGQLMASQISGLVYFDGSTNVVIAIPQDSIGQVLPSLHEVLYTNAFSTALCDVLYCYTRAGFEQNVVIRQQLPAPASFGLTGSNIWLQVWTEFSVASAPQINQSQGEVGDCILDFGMMKMGKGKAFMLGDRSSSVPVTKQWLNSDGRTFLIESVLLSALAPQMQQLPAGSNSSGGNNSVPSSSPSSGGGQSKVRRSTPLLASSAPPRQKLAQINLPTRKVAKKSHVPMRLATATPVSQGLVLDYNLSGSYTGFVFASDVTYYVSGPTYVYGTTTFEGGAVIKYANDPTASLIGSTVTTAYTTTGFSIPTGTVR